MSFQPADTDIFGYELPEDSAELRYLCRAVELGGEGESQLLVGPLPGHQGSYYAVRKKVSFDDDTGEIHVSGTWLEEAGASFLEALKQLNLHWQKLEVLYVAPHLREELLSTGKTIWDGFESTPLQCTAVYRQCRWWADGIPRDAYWVEGDLDQVRELMGQVMFDHQQQLQSKAHLPYPVLVSADGSERYAMPLSDDDPEEPWPPEDFERITPVDVMDIYYLPEALLPALSVEATLEYYRQLKGGDTVYPLQEIAQVTWPLIVVRDEQGEEPKHIIYFVHGQGMEEGYWEVPGEEGEEEAVKLSVQMRNLYRLGVLEGQKSGECDYLNYAIEAVRKINR